jgi:hypothetical protein
MAVSAILFLNANLPYHGPFALELPRRHPPGLGSLDYKLQGMYVVEPCGHLERVLADTVRVLVMASHSTATLHAADRDQPAGPFQASEVGPLTPLIAAVAGKPGGSGMEALPSAGAPQVAFHFYQERRGPCTSPTR